MDNKKVFKVTLEGHETEIAVLRPNMERQQRGQLVFSRRFKELVKPSDGKPGAIVRAALNDVLKEQGLWSDEKQTKFEEVTKSILENEKRLAKSGIGKNKKLTKKEAYDIAIQMRRDRWVLRELNRDRNSLDLNTAEAQAENARFAYLVAACTVYNDTGKQYFRDDEDYLKRIDDPVADKAAQFLGRMVYGVDDDWEKKLPENKFLFKYGFCNSDLHLVNKEGKLVDTLGRRVDSDGNLLDENDNIIDWEGDKLTKDGEYDFGGEPEFADDEEIKQEANEKLEPVSA